MKTSPTMDRAIAFAHMHGGYLLRSPGGFWHAASEHKVHGVYSSLSFGTPTVEAIVRRGFGEYTDWQEGRKGRFPVRMTVKESA